VAQKKCTASPGGVRLVYVDECEVHLPPRLAKIRQKRGRPVRVPAAGADRKCAVCGALDYASGQVHWQLSLRKDSPAFVPFLEQWRQTWPEEKLVIALGNVGDHKSRQPLAWWQRRRHQVGPLSLPAYTPELNLMGRVWRHVKGKLSCHRRWADWRALWRATAALLGHLTARFHQTHGPSIEVVQDFCSST
jgi:DDE superfamily endonuclease